MGLDTTHDCWHGPYSSFTLFRNELGRVAGYKVEPRKYASGFTSDTVVLDWDGIERANRGCYLGDWNRPQSDPLVYLIVHSDCDGVIHPAQGVPLAARLEELAHTYDQAIQVRHPWMVGKAAQFAAGLRTAAALGEDVEFQ